MPDTIRLPARDATVVARSDVVVVGGGPAGLAAAVAASREGAGVTLLERYPHLGGMAAGAGATGQILAATKPETLKTSAPPEH